MYLRGSYVNCIDDEVGVYMLTGLTEKEIELVEGGVQASSIASASSVVEIGGEDSCVKWSGSPVTVSCQAEDSFGVLLSQSASVTIECSGLQDELFVTNCRYAPVIVTRRVLQGKDAEVMFAGYIAPLTFQQPYNEEYDTLTLNCIDALSAMKYSAYRRIGSRGRSYKTVKGEARYRSFGEILTEALDDSLRPLRVLAQLAGIDVRADGDCLGGLSDYDGSKTLSGGNIFEEVGVNELLMIGGSEDGTWTNDEVVSEVLRYLNLHIRMNGFKFEIFDWRSIWKGDSVVDIRSGIVTDCGCQLSIPETYNRIAVTCETVPVSEIVEDPLSASGLLRQYPRYQKYMTELSSAGEGDDALSGFFSLVTGGSTDYEHARQRDWYMQVMKHTSWTLSEPLDPDVIAQGTWQDRYLSGLRQGLHAAFVKMAKIETAASQKDNSTVTSLSMTPYLVISVNGNLIDGEAGARPNGDDILAAAPVARYTSHNAGGVFSPTDEGYTNYICISGSLTLNPVMKMSVPWCRAKDCDNVLTLKLACASWNKDIVVPSRENEDGRYYTRKYWTAEHGGESEAANVSDTDGFYPYTEDGPEELEFRYSAVGDGTDTISKVGVLQCMLVIGDKCVVETGDGSSPDCYEWRDYRTLEELGGDVEAYYGQSFSIGFNPKIGDKLIGVKYDIQSNFDYRLGLSDVSGTVIPIRCSDRVSGKVDFRILGPVNTLWNVVTRRHPTFFRHTEWEEASVPVLSHVSSIVVENFEVKVVSDAPEQEGEDVTYVSDTDETYANVKDDVRFRICSALTSSEADEYGVSPAVSLSTAVSMADGSGVTAITDVVSGERVKAEVAYVDAYYTEYSCPRVMMTQSLRDVAANVSCRYLYRHPSLSGRLFYVLGYERDLTAGTCVMRLRESNG